MIVVWNRWRGREEEADRDIGRQRLYCQQCFHISRISSSLFTVNHVDENSTVQNHGRQHLKRIFLCQPDLQDNIEPWFPVSWLVFCTQAAPTELWVEVCAQRLRVMLKGAASPQPGAGCRGCRLSGRSSVKNTWGRRWLQRISHKKIKYDAETCHFNEYQLFDFNEMWWSTEPKGRKCFTVKCLWSGQKKKNDSKKYRIQTK